MKKYSFMLVIFFGIQLLAFIPNVCADSGTATLYPMSQSGIHKIELHFADCKSTDTISIRVDSQNDVGFIVAAGNRQDIIDFPNSDPVIYGNNSGEDILNLDQDLVAGFNGDFAVAIVAKNAKVIVEYKITKSAYFPWYILIIIGVALLAVSPVIIKKKKKTKSGELTQTTKI